LCQVLSHEPLRVSLQDLHSADTKGKWWLVGAAWGGDPLVDRKSELEKRVEFEQQVKQQESNLVKLARKQGMNSDIRRSIFVVVMSSEVSCTITRGDGGGEFSTIVRTMSMRASDLGNSNSQKSNNARSSACFFIAAEMYAFCSLLLPYTYS